MGGGTRNGIEAGNSWQQTVEAPDMKTVEGLSGVFQRHVELAVIAGVDVEAVVQSVLESNRAAELGVQE